MTLWTVIPVKRFDEAKRRLSSVLSPIQRAELAAAFFEHTLKTALNFAGNGRVLIVSGSEEVLDRSRALGAATLLETSCGGLNAALEQAANVLRAQGSTKLMVVASDLPLLGVDDLYAMTNTAPDRCAIAPDRRRLGTNAILWPESVRPEFLFGERSFAAHRDVAIRRKLPIEIVLRKGLEFDLDEPADLLDYAAYDGDRAYAPGTTTATRPRQ